MTAPHRAHPARALALALACGLALAASGARAEEEAPAGAAPTIYKWVDANGIAHYTTDLGRVPRSVRGSVRALGGGGAASPGDGFASRDASPDAPPDAAPATPPDAAPATAPAEWDQGGAAAAASASAPPPAGDEGFATEDRPAEQPGDEEDAAPASAEAPAQGAPTPDPARSGDLDARIAALEAEIASDEEALKGLLAAPAPSDPGEIAYDRSFREVAERLPKRLAELRTLQSERAQLDQP